MEAQWEAFVEGNTLSLLKWVCPYGILRTNRESLENQGFAVVGRVFILFQIVRTSLKKSLIYRGCKMDDK